MPVLKHLAFVIRWWVARIGLKRVLILTSLTTVIVLIAGCYETYGPP